MAEFVEIRATVEGHEKAAEVAHAILCEGLATSIEISEVPSPGPGISWQLTLIAPATDRDRLERRLERAGGDLAAAVPVQAGFDPCPDWLSGPPPA
ncbi:hypothetical protein HII36_33835 [Nonomuraea sp. NN258]|uniref:hypothetical protein n=1 Tax=Nonomuraea antri TaxID=2730852 RepID=UPI00156958E7|nr:hypothetical protein [Nonomuraea antri]NRQ36782.1 hypothetical protein [Nonomuraea antri]